MRDYEVIIGLEIHCVLDTKTKAFCHCHNEFGALPNTLTCPVCLGLPGAIPLLNRTAVEYAIIAGLSFGSDISSVATFERKNYFYPDSSTSYQITEFNHPICTGGGVKLKHKFIRFNRIQLEEDAGKLIHNNDDGMTYIDYNRCGVPLIEIVTMPDFRNFDEVIEFLIKLRRILMYTGVAKCKLEEGGLKFDVNISVKDSNNRKLGTRVEMKNLNSFRSVFRAIDYESHRQINLLEEGNTVLQETRGWDDEKGRSFSMRVKEDENDYRYFPEPDIRPIKISKSDILRLNKLLPESIDSRIDRYSKLNLCEQDIDLIISDKGISDYFDKVYSLTGDYKESINWIKTELLRVNKDIGSIHLEDIITSEDLAFIISKVKSNEITRNNAKILFDEIVKTGEDAESLIKELDIEGDVGKQDVVDLVKKLINDNPYIINDYKTDPDKVMNYFIGGVMKYTNGKAKVEYITPLIVGILNDIK